MIFKKSYFNHIQQQRSDGDKNTSGRGNLDVKIDTVQTHGVITSSGDQIDSTINDLDEGIDKGFEGLLQRGLNDHICPKTQTVHELPVIHRVNATK